MTASQKYTRIAAAMYLLMALPASAQETSSEPPTKLPALTDSEPSRERCLDVHTQAQIRRRESALLEASELLKICSSRSCPDAIQNDCIQWTTEIEQQIPSIVIEGTSARRQSTCTRTR
jgi:hypothetical protein